jgi:hypothetical protein
MCIELTLQCALLLHPAGGISATRSRTIRSSSLARPENFVARPHQHQYESKDYQKNRDRVYNLGYRYGLGYIITTGSRS